MSFKQLILMMVAVACVTVSCKKDQEDSSLPNLDGILSLNVPEFVLTNTKYTFKASGVTHPEDKSIEYVWKVSPTMSSYDTTATGSYEFTFSDTLATYTIYCFASAEDYSSSTATKYATTVKGGLDGSVKGTGVTTRDPYFFKDGIRYYYVPVGGNQWMRRNLEHNQLGIPFYGYDVMTDVFGTFFTYEEAIQACPEGWRLPGEADWKALAVAMGAPADIKDYQNIPDMAASLIADASFNDEMLWEYWPAVGDITNKSGLSMLPLGYASAPFLNSSWNGLYEYAVFWTADSVPGEDNMAYYRYIFAEEGDLMIGKADKKSFAANVRCVRSN